MKLAKGVSQEGGENSDHRPPAEDLYELGSLGGDSYVGEQWSEPEEDNDSEPVLYLDDEEGGAALPEEKAEAAEAPERALEFKDPLSSSFFPSLSLSISCFPLSGAAGTLSNVAVSPLCLCGEITRCKRVYNIDAVFTRILHEIQEILRES